MTDTTVTPATQTMTAAYQTRYGGSAQESIEMRHVAIPEVAPGRVLIKVAASTTNALDWHYMTGTPYFLRFQNGFTTPKRKVPGADVSGTVVAVGTDVTDFSVGDRVFGEIDEGGFAEYALANPSTLADAPTSIPLEEAATLGVAALTALQGLRDWAGLKSGDKVLVNGGSGGVGTFAIQIAKALGASHVTAVVSTANVDVARSIGADRVIDYRKQDFTDIDEKFDVFFDNAGSKSLTRSRRMLTTDGVFVMVTGKKGRWFRPADRLIGGALRSRFWSQRWGNGVAQASGADGEILARMVDEGRIRPVIDRRFKLEEAVEALAYQAEGHARGKSLVVVS